MKQEDLKSLVDIPRPPHASGNRMLRHLKDFNSMPFMSEIEDLRRTAKIDHPIEEGNYYVTTSLDDDGWGKRTSMCKEYTAPRNREDSKQYASIDAEKEIGPVLNVEFTSNIDVPGIEVQVPPLSSPGYSVWILISRGHERFVNEIHRHNSDIVNCSSSLLANEDNFNDVCLESSKRAVVNQGQGSQDSNDVKTKVEPSSMHRETVASSIRVAPASSQSSSGGSGGRSNPTSIHLEVKSIYVKKEIPKEDRIWIIILGCPKCKRDSFETRISRCVTNMVRHHDQDERETDGARHWHGVFSVLKGKCQNQLGKEFTDEGWLHCFYLGSIKTRFEICRDEN